MTSLPSLGCLSKIDTSAWPQVIVQGSLGEAAWPVISRITKGKFFPCPFGKLPLFRKRKVYMHQFCRLCQPWLGKAWSHCLGTVGCSAFLNSPIGIISPAFKPPGSQTSLHISRGENQHCFTTWQIPCCSDTSTHPLLPISISFCQHLSSRSLFKVAFPKRRNPSSIECADVQTHMKCYYFPNKEGSFSVIAFPGRVRDQATKDLWWWSSFSTRWAANTSCTHLSFCLWLCSRRNTFHFLRNKCYDSRMDWIKSTKTRPLSQRPQILWKKI